MIQYLLARIHELTIPAYLQLLMTVPFLGRPDSGVARRVDESIPRRMPVIMRRLVYSANLVSCVLQAGVCRKVPMFSCLTVLLGRVVNSRISSYPSAHHGLVGSC